MAKDTVYVGSPEGRAALRAYPWNLRPVVERESKALYEEAYLADPHRVEEVTRAVLARDVFVWSNLSDGELRALRRVLYTIVLEARGSAA